MHVEGVSGCIVPWFVANRLPLPIFLTRSQDTETVEEEKDLRSSHVRSKESKTSNATDQRSYHRSSIGSSAGEHVNQVTRVKPDQHINVAKYTTPDVTE